jgi:hypothetical protein
MVFYTFTIDFGYFFRGQAGAVRASLFIVAVDARSGHSTRFAVYSEPETQNNPKLEIRNYKRYRNYLSVRSSYQTSIVYPSGSEKKIYGEPGTNSP